ncbi:hypothetical protein DB32_001427 [Sandaracinus amylolyticus]|uniref:Uncharacterized protein n=1 Tax=Sandaracinus amylolyticus TaxID=927083 RepID=A0A0F6YGT0_9BACT|nr:hypothetical protein DB32_001427 [Sandaracinus amylolyticus]
MRGSSWRPRTRSAPAGTIVLMRARLYRAAVSLTRERKLVMDSHA